MRRALAIDEASFGKDHPSVAIDLNNLARCCRPPTGSAEAEPLMRRAVEILGRFERKNGHRHPNCDMVEANYTALRAALGEQR